MNIFVLVPTHIWVILSTISIALDFIINVICVLGPFVICLSAPAYLEQDLQPLHIGWHDNVRIFRKSVLLRYVTPLNY